MLAYAFFGGEYTCMKTGIELVDENDVRAEGLNVLLEFLIEARDERGDDHHRDGSDDASTHRQERPELVGAERLQRHANTVAQVLLFHYRHWKKPGFARLFRAQRHDRSELERP